MKIDATQSSVERYTPLPEQGLSTEQVNERLSKNLNNYVKQKYSKSLLSIFVGNICTFFNLLGLIVFIALLLVNASISNFFFVIFYVTNTSIGIIQEIRAKKCIDKLSLLSQKLTKVIRNGQELEIPSSQIVLDDVVILGIGNQIPTDCKILTGDIEVNEALLTGESVAIKKHPGDELFAGSFITSGVCKVQAIKVGRENYVEQLSEKAKQYKKPRSEIMNSLKIIIKAIGFVIVPIAIAFMLKSLLLSGGNWIENIPEAVLGTSTVVVGMIPAGMFLLTSVALAVGIIKLSRHNTLVQDLYSLEMLARVDTICFDKTGTITDGKMTVKEVILLSDKSSKAVTDTVSSMMYALKDNNQTAIALQDYFGQNCIFNSEKILPFNSSRKLSAVTFDNGTTYAFGAPEFVLDDKEFKKVESHINEYARMGLRVLILASSSTPLDDDKIPNDFTPVALIIIADNVRADAITTIQWFKDNDVAIKVISGDNPITVSEVSKRVGILNADKYISLEGMSDEEVAKIANEYTVFGRVSPEQKAILIKAIREQGHVTAMTGDGVNDILALKEADCAISVAAGSDAARNVSHLVLMDNNFNSMPKVVHEGRRVINNVQCSASLFLMKTLFTMFMGIVTLCLPYMHTYPFRLPHMIMIEVLVIGIPAFFLSFQPNDARVSGRFISYVIKKSLPGATLMLLSVIIIEILKNNLGIFDESVYTTMSVFALTYAGIVNLFATCRPLNRYRTLLFFASTACVTAIVLFAIIFGIPMLSFTQMLPLTEYWHHILIVIA
ncbi:MAG: HAD-IC family P-type ATPase, partial [Clostridia bacterium]|nr:HAD-IC family P-type ATPase [Clostridia bacterium]